MGALLRTTSTRKAIRIRPIRMLIPCVRKHGDTVFSHLTHVVKDCGPRECRTKSLACWTSPTADRKFSSHHGPAINSASKPALRWDAKLGTVMWPQRSTANQNARRGNANAKNDALDRHPRPIAKPSPIQLCEGSDLRLQIEKT